MSHVNLNSRHGRIADILSCRKSRSVCKLEKLQELLVPICSPFVILQVSQLSQIWPEREAREVHACQPINPEHQGRFVLQIGQKPTRSRQMTDAIDIIRATFGKAEEDDRCKASADALRAIYGEGNWQAAEILKAVATSRRANEAD